MRLRLGALALAAAGALLVLYPAIRPYSDETSLQGAAAFASTAWIVAHVLAMLGFILVALGLLALYGTLRDTSGERLAFLALITTWICVGLTLPYFGVEAFGLHVLGQEAIRQNSTAVVNLANDVRYGPGIFLFGPGLLLLGVGAILAAVCGLEIRHLAEVERPSVRTRIRAVHPAVLWQSAHWRGSWIARDSRVPLACGSHLARKCITAAIQQLGLANP